MLVLNAWGEVDRDAISSKLGLYVSNFKESPREEWSDVLQSEFRQVLKAVSAVNSKGIEEILIEVAAEYGVEVDSDGEWNGRIVDGMIFVDFDCIYEDMPLGDWRTNCFDGRFCSLTPARS